MSPPTKGRTVADVTVLVVVEREAVVVLNPKLNVPPA